ncbi:uncharacterized protein LOC128327950 [Hemicordylus capensis]|uniref:uncharacterized protein LOC128327950 n=1 Tax=Hemicordylus capensis TaxID=884348 RepID=UPI002302EC52|nr:uncharacterized protein LOC128327950 [Hemicordylus capensis]XP_053113340.1 uncharacterized protein LOC128327950 [Hemicordylus capensis]
MRVILFCYFLYLFHVPTEALPLAPISHPNMWVRHAYYMFHIYGTNVSLIYEHPLSVSHLSFLPTPINSPETIVGHLQNLKRSMLFTDPPEELNATTFRLLRYRRALPGLCFCCHNSGTWDNKWKDHKKVDHWRKDAGNYSGCTDRFYLHGKYNNSYVFNVTALNGSLDDLYTSFPMFMPNLTGLSGASICSGWQIKDPNLWFFFNSTATNYHPGQYLCAAVGYLTLPVQVVPPITTRPSLQRARRDVMGPQCQDEVIIGPQLSEGSSGGRAMAGSFTGFLTLGSYPGIIAQEKRWSVIGLTCRLEKTINATGRIVRDLQEELAGLHQDQMQLRFAVDFLLAKSGGFCTVVGSSGCQVHYHDLNRTIEDELTHLKSLIANNKSGTSNPFAGLWNWLPGTDWVKGILMSLLGPLIVVLLCICCAPFLLQCTTNHLQRTMHGIAQTHAKVMYMKIANEELRRLEEEP